MSLLRVSANVLLTTSLLMQNPVPMAGVKRMHAEGTFTVRTLPQESSDFEKSAGIARFAFEKEWSGTLAGSSQCEMLSSKTESTGAMVYVALEKFDGRLNGRQGSFYFSHVGTMQQGDPASAVLRVVIVKNSGTQELKGLSGELAIRIEAGQHFYTLDYELPDR